MIQRETYMRRIRPVIGNDLIKVMTGIRRSGKSVMLELIQEELAKSGVSETQFISINFEKSLREPKQSKEKPICFLMKFRRFLAGRNVSTRSAFPLTATSTSPAPMRSCSPASWRRTSAGGMWSL